MPGASPVGRFPAGQRLRKRREFLEAQAAGLRITTPRLVLLLHRRDASRPARLGVVASRKVGGAVTRNRAKRLVREAFRATRDLFQSGIDLVVIVRRPLEAANLSDVTDEIRGVTPQIEKRTREVLSRPEEPSR